MSRGKRLLNTVLVAMVFVLTGCGSTSPDCEKAFDKLKACFVQVSDCSTCPSNASTTCGVYKQYSYTEVCALPGFDCSCSGANKIAADHVLATTDTPGTCCSEHLQ